MARRSPGVSRGGRMGHVELKVTMTQKVMGRRPGEGKQGLGRQGIAHRNPTVAPEDSQGGVPAGLPLRPGPAQASGRPSSPECLKAGGRQCSHLANWKVSEKPREVDQEPTSFGTSKNTAQQRRC